MTGARSLLILTMPGFGIETLRHLVNSPAWPTEGVSVGLIGQRPPAWRQVAARLRRAWRRPQDRTHRLADSALAAGEAERFLRSRGMVWRWLDSDDAVRAHRAALRPGLTLTITSRIVFSPKTLADGGGEWLNVHPGLLPQYAGASPAPYMYLDGVGGCTIHRMVARVDAGAIVDRAPMSGPLGEDGGVYFFDRLPAHTASRLAALLQSWVRGEAWVWAPDTDPRVMHHCSSRRLAVDRQLDWRWSAERLMRWVRALAAIAPAWWDDGRGQRIEALSAERAPPAAAGGPGTVHACRGRWIEVECADGVVALRGRARPRVRAGQRLPLRERGAQG